MQINVNFSGLEDLIAGVSTDLAERSKMLYEQAWKEIADNDKATELFQKHAESEKVRSLDIVGGALLAGLRFCQGDAPVTVFTRPEDRELMVSGNGRFLGAMWHKDRGAYTTHT